MVRRRPPARAGPAGSRWTGRTSSGGWRGCWTVTAAPTPATSTVPCSSSSNGWPPKTSYRTRWPGAAAARTELVPVFTSQLRGDHACGQQLRAALRHGSCGAPATVIRLAELPALLRPWRLAAQRHRPVAAGITSRGEGGRPHRPDRPPASPSRTGTSGPLPARPGRRPQLGGREQPRAADRRSTRCSPALAAVGWTQCHRFRDRLRPG